MMTITGGTSFKNNRSNAMQLPLCSSRLAANTLGLAFAVAVSSRQIHSARFLVRVGPSNHQKYWPENSLLNHALNPSKRLRKLPDGSCWVEECSAFV
ncbi:hypothetical protein ACX5DB_003897 [Enterobacter ludwigii]|jgi:hypothetical protein